MNDVNAELQTVATKLLSPSHAVRSSALLTYLSPDARHSSPWAATHGIASIKRTLELWAAFKEDVQIDSTSFDPATGIATIQSRQTYTIPFVHVISSEVASSTYLHLVKKGDTYLIDSMDDSGVVGEWLSAKLPTLNNLLVPIASLIVPFLGSLLLIASNVVTHAQKAASSRPSLLKFPLHPVAATESVSAIALLVFLGTSRWFVALWQNYIGDAYKVDIKLSSLPAPHKSNVTFRRAEAMVPLGAPLKKRKVPEAAKPENLQSNPVPGESYADAVKEDHKHSVPSSLHTNVDHSKDTDNDDHRGPDSASPSSKHQDFPHSDEQGAFSYAKVVAVGDHAH